MNATLLDLRNELLGTYPAEQWPALLQQVEQWSQSRPLEGVRILDNTPLFRNTCAKFLALLAAGADLYVLDRALTFGDPEAVKLAVKYGAKCLSLEELQRMEQAGEAMDMVLDCNAEGASLTPRYGFVELTRSGVAHFVDCPLPVMVADAGQIKLLETALGTSDGLFRALAHFGHADFEGKSLVVVGCGKVGLGVIVRAQSMGMKVTALDLQPCEALPEGVDFLLMDNREAVQSAMESAWCVVTVTGHADALLGRVDLARLVASPAILANLGVEDEYSSLVPDARVLANKQTVNFELDDPTRMPYIETTMALHNACALDLLKGSLSAGCHQPNAAVEAEMLRVVAEKGCIPAEELAWISLLFTAVLVK
ncbi:MAG: NAD(P)-dependent oxidoreductase [Akkermansia sp.]